MKIDWMTVVCTIAVIAMGVFAFYAEYGIGFGKKDEDQASNQLKDDEIVGNSEKESE